MRRWAHAQVTGSLTVIPDIDLETAWSLCLVLFLPPSLFVKNPSRNILTLATGNKPSNLDPKVGRLILTWPEAWLQLLWSTCHILRDQPADTSVHALRQGL